MKNIYLRILDEHAVRSSIILATITRASGSTPQKPGSSALFGKTGLLSGTVGGGVLEGEVQMIVQSAMVSKKSGHFHFKLNNDINQKEEAICGGQVSVLVDATPANHLAVFEQVKQSMHQRIPGVLISQVTALNDNEVEIHRLWVTGSKKDFILTAQLKKVQHEIESMIEAGDQFDYRELLLSQEEKNISIFLEPVFPLPRLVIAGAGHIGKALAHLGSLLDFEVTIIDDRSEYANRENIPDADHIIVDDIGKAMLALEKTSDAYIVIVTRGHKDDAEALKSCIGSGATYIGMIGSANKIALMRKKFIDEGLASSWQWDAIHAPIGLEIRSKTVQEIAVSIAAQLVQVRNLKVKAYA